MPHLITVLTAVVGLCLRLHAQLLKTIALDSRYHFERPCAQGVLVQMDVTQPATNSTY